MTDVIKHMRDRFLAWRLPEDFAPDGGIEFSQRGPHGPTGTNLFTAVQAEAMIRHMLECAPAASQPEAEPVAWRFVLEQYRDDLCEGFCKEDHWSDAGHSHPDMQRDCGGCRAAAALLAHLTPAPVVPADGLVEAMREAIDLLKERKHGSPARSPGHNARLVLEDALRAQQPAAPVGGVTVQEAARVLLDRMGDDWGKAVNAMTPILRADLKETAWNSVSEMRDALFAALSALEGK